MLLVLSVLSATTSLLYATNVFPSSLCSLALFKWDVSVDGVKPTPGPTLDLHLMLSISFFHCSRVYPKLSVTGRRRFLQVSALLLAAF